MFLLQTIALDLKPGGAKDLANANANVQEQGGKHVKIGALIFLTL